MSKNLKTFKQFAAENPWTTEGALRAQRHNSKPRKNSRGRDLPVNGFAAAFIEIGGRVLIDGDVYFEIIDKQNQTEAA